jgi:hypothetical protein
MKSILSDIVGKYSKQLENICSESLALIINDSVELKIGFKELLRTLSEGKINLENNFNIKTQVTSKKDSAVPDLEILDSSEQTYLIEAKFWAGLTEHQPISYLKRIHNGGVLVFLAPERRLNSLGNEVGSKLGRKEKTGSAIIEVSPNTSIVFVSWTKLLDSLWNHALNSSEQTTLHNLYQLKSLVEKLDTEGFIPLDSQLFTPATGIQRDQMIDLLDMVVENNKLMDTKSLTYGGGKYAYLRFFKLESTHEIPFNGFLLYSSQLWSKNEETPLYLCIQYKNWSHDDDNIEVPELVRKLDLAGVQHYPKEILNDKDPCLIVPLHLLLQASKEDEYNNLKLQVDRIVDIWMN